MAIIRIEIKFIKKKKKGKIRMQCIMQRCLSGRGSGIVGPLAFRSEPSDFLNFFFHLPGHRNNVHKGLRTLGNLIVTVNKLAC